MEKFIIEGGYPLKGAFVPSGNKNEALPVLAATLLTKEKVVLRNLPVIKDVEIMEEILLDLGAFVERTGVHELTVQVKDVKTTTLDRDLCNKIRASILLIGPMISRFGKVTIPPPGGDVIGRRRTDTHFNGFIKLGAKLEITENYNLTAQGLQGTEFFLDERSVTATENLILAAVLAKGKTVLHNVACEPHVVGLISMLRKMGADIKESGFYSLTINGVEELKGCEHDIGSDYLEIVSVIGLSAVTNSDITIKGVQRDVIRIIMNSFEKLGIKVTYEGNDIRVPPQLPLAIRTELHGEIPRIDTAPWPAFPTDLMSIAITIATQAKGTVLLFEKMYDGRMFFVDSLISMGAKIILCDPHRVVVTGPSKLYATRLESPDIRAGMALLTAALCAQGTSIIYNIRQIDRGYERIDLKLRRLGARINRVSD